MTATERHSSTGVELLCIHDLPRDTCALCTRHADARDPEFMSEFGGEQGFDFFGELGHQHDSNKKG